MPISSCAYSIQPSLVGYDLNVVFFNDIETPISTKTFSFAIPVMEGNEEEQMVDFYSQNGTCSNNILTKKKLFQPSDVDNVFLADGLIKNQDMKGPRVFVLDLYDRKTGYREGSTIAKCEEVVCDFFTGKRVKASSHAEYIRDAGKADFIFCEGSMKVSILKNFSVDQVEFFHTEDGRKDLCQITEIFMNSFKFGHWSVLEAEDFVKLISGKALKPCRKSIVLYPEEYAHMYALNSPFFSTVIAPIFTASGGVDKTGITIAEVVKV